MKYLLWKVETKGVTENWLRWIGVVTGYWTRETVYTTPCTLERIRTKWEDDSSHEDNGRKLETQGVQQKYGFVEIPSTWIITSGH